MTTILKFVYAALLAAAAMNFAPATAAAEEPAHGKFTLTHEVHWANAVIPAGEYSFSYDPYSTTPVLTLTKLSGARAGFMLLVPTADPSTGSDSNELVVETTAAGSYVTALELVECGMALHFAVPSHTVKQMAKAVPPVGPSVQ
jgi:hypothetical protein